MAGWRYVAGSAIRVASHSSFETAGPEYRLGADLCSGIDHDGHRVERSCFRPDPTSCCQVCSCDRICIDSRALGFLASPRDWIGREPTKQPRVDASRAWPLPGGSRESVSSSRTGWMKAVPTIGGRQ